jgi:hypothetical protein
MVSATGATTEDLAEFYEVKARKVKSPDCYDALRSSQANLRKQNQMRRHRLA